MLLELARQVVPSPKLDSAMRKELAALQDKLHARAKHHVLHVDPFSPEELNQLLEQ